SRRRHTRFSRDWSSDVCSSDLNLIEKSGSWYSFDGERIGQGRENARQFLAEHPEICDRLENLLLEKHGVRRNLQLSAVPSEEDEDRKSVGRDRAKRTICAVQIR